MTTQTERLTMAQALVRFLKNQYVERDGAENPFFAGCFGIFGHGIVAGVGQALMENPDFRYYQVRNEQSSVHAASRVRQGEEPPANLRLPLVHRAGRHQHDHRRGRRRPSTACPCC